MEFRLLGPLELLVGHRRIDPGPAKQRILLAALLAEAGRVVPTDTLIGQVWDEAPPDNARNVLHTYVARVRRVLSEAGDADGDAGDDAGGDASLQRRPGGYALVVAPQRVDLHRFRALAEQARTRLDDPAGRSALLGAALDLWRGEPLAGLPGAWADRMREGLREQRLRVLVDWADAELALGHAGDVVDRLHEPAGEYPLSETLAARLVRAYHRSGRTAEALAAYARIRQRIVDELGAEPGAELRAVHETILAAKETDPAEPDGPLPAQLPLDGPGFVGRSGALARLGELLADRSATVVVSAVSGTAGVGKTALAVHWAHRVAGHFPDGQLYANLRGFDPGGTAVEPGEVVRRFLDALGVPAHKIPESVDGQADLYRTLLADRRILVLLDNARDAEQVRPLLPGAPGCLALITSRQELTSLVAVEGAHPVPLDLLAPDEARTLLAQRIGPVRVAAEPAAVTEIVARCAGLPLALTIVAARASIRPKLPLSALAAELRGSLDRLDALSTGDAPTDLRTVFSWSLRSLSEDASRLFRLLGLHPGPDISTAAAASLAGRPPAQVRRPLAELTRAHLVAEHRPGRYVLHDLLRDYAMELAAGAEDAETGDRRGDAVRRVFDHYLHTAYDAAMLLTPTRDRITLGPRQPGVTPEKLDNQEDALRWFAAEQPVLLSTLARAEELGHHTYHWQLAWSLTDCLDRQGEWLRWAEIQRAALASVEKLGDAHAHAIAHRLLTRPYVQLRRYDEVHEHLGQALELFRSCDDRAGQANCLYDMGWVWEMQHRDDFSGPHIRHSLGLFREALELYRAADHLRGQATTSSGIGWYLALLGDHREGLVYCREAATILSDLNDVHGEAATWDSLGYIHSKLGDHAEALHCYERAVSLCRKLGDRYWESYTLTHLGDAYRAHGDPEAAAHQWRQALAILTDLGHADADDLREKLAKS